MPISEHPRDLVRFGDFELDPAAGELRSAGSTIRLQPQPLKVLLALLRSPGEVVSREQLKRELMPAGPYGDADHALNLAVTKLRCALQDSSDKPQFIDTLPRRGYRFVAPVQISCSEAGCLQEKPQKHAKWKIAGMSAAVLLLLSAVILVLVLRRHSERSRDKDAIVVAAFSNNTGDSAFDNTLRQGLLAELLQAPALNLLSDERISWVLPLMMQPGNSRLTNELAREVCQRTSSAVTIEGSIATLGNRYVLEFRVVNCNTGDLLLQEQTVADSKEQVLGKLREAAKRLHGSLGAFLRSREVHGPPTEYVTTPSIAALQAYTLAAHAIVESRDESAAIPLLERAIILDSAFAMAYAQIGAVYEGMGQSLKAAENIQRAYDLREKVSERERLCIEAAYERIVTGNLEAARKKHLLLAHIYPNDPVLMIDLASVELALGKCDRAAEILQEATRLAPENSMAYAGLVEAETCRSKNDAAKAAADEAERRHLDVPRIHASLYKIGFLQHDFAAMGKQAAYLAGTPEWGAFILCTEASTAAYGGQLQSARSLVRRATDFALLADQPELAANCHADAALWEALAGNAIEARHQAHSALLFANSRNVEAKSAIALALADDSSLATHLLRNLAQRYPQDTNVQFKYLPSIRSAIALHHGNATDAVDVLALAAAYDLPTLYSMFLCGRNYLANGRTNDAISEFRNIVDHPGVVGNDPIGALVLLELGRAYRMAGDTERAKSAYVEFLSVWTKADPDVPVLQQAKSEFERLPR